MKTLILLLLAVLGLTLTGCNSSSLDTLFGDADDDADLYIEGDGNTVNVQDSRDGGNTVDESTRPVVVPSAGNIGLIGLFVLASIALSGCINSQVTFSPVASIGVNSGNMGSGTGMGTDEETGLSFAPAVEREGGASVSTEADLSPDSPVLP